jgi:hypothetical protein
MLLWNQRDATCPVLSAEIFRFHPDANHFYIPRRSVPMQGRIAIVTNAGRNAVDAGCAFDERRLARGRRSRVVLTPRRWRQVGERNFTDDGDKKADHRGEREAAVKTIAQGMPGAGSTGRRNSGFFHLRQQLVKRFRWRFPAKRLSRSTIESRCHG